MKDKIKNFIIPFVLMMIFDLGYFYLVTAPNFGGELNPHLGILFISGLFFGPYGCIGAVIANFICDLFRGYSIQLAVLSAIVSFLVSYLAYKLWYTKNPKRFPITKPRLNNIYNMIYLIIMVNECGLLYSTLTANIIEMCYPESMGLNFHIGLQYFTNFVNYAFLFTIIFMLISQLKDFSYTPEISEKTYDEKKYVILYYIIAISVIINIISDFSYNTYNLNMLFTIVTIILLIIYSKKPIKYLNKIEYVSIPEKIMNYFATVTLIVLVVEITVIFSPLRDGLSILLHFIATNQQYLIMLLIIDVIILMFFIPALLILKYIEDKIVTPIKSFSTIGTLIKKHEKIESDTLLDIYSEYVDQDDEIGILSRSYTDLINYNNDYIENLKHLESEKQRIETELNIAHNIQLATLPKNIIDNKHIKVEGYCRAAREVGGDFYDFYEIDEDNTMIVIGDASGKGVPAAIVTIITQQSIKLLIKNELNPGKVLTDVNNQICENNTEMMFITLFLAIYNNKTHKLTYANAGHTPPIIKNNENYELLDIDSEIVLGVWEDYEYTNHEIELEEEMILYTDGITDAQNANDELYGEERILHHINTNKNGDIINSLISDINNFSKGMEQFDDMTLLIIKVKK